MSKKVLLTGSKGLVGSSLNVDVPIGKEFDLIKFSETKKMFEINNPTHVIHCAGKIGGLGANMSQKGQFFYENIMINTNIVECCRLFKVKKLLGFLSTCIFPDNIDYPITENKIHLGPPHNSNYPYAYAKRMFDIQLKAYREQYELNYISVIPTNIYGPNDNFSIENGHVLPSLIHKIFLAKKNKTDFIVWGSGKPLREFIFSRDVAKLTMWALDNYYEEDPIIFSNSQEISIRDIVDILVDVANYNGKVIFDDTKPDGQYRKHSDNSKLKKYLPNFEFTPIFDGIKETYEWFEINYESCRK
jgi:GDP-L-fucose synthase